MKVKLLFSLLLWAGMVAAQKTIRIPLNAKVEDDKLKKTQAIVPVYKYTGNAIEPYRNFGVDNLSAGQWIQLKKLPDMSLCIDTAYSFLYFSGADNAINSGYLMVLIGNYSRMARRTVHFFVDKNNNLDFTDDGEPLLLPFEKDSIVVALQNIKVPGSAYEVKLSRVVFGKDMAYKNLLTDYYIKHSGKKQFTKISNCYREQRYNLCSADFKLDQDSFTIGVKDMDVNALYNDNGTDRIYIGPYKKAIISEDLPEYKSGKKKTQFEWNEKVFYIKDIEPTGKWVDLEWAPHEKISKRLKVFCKVPKIEFANEMSVKYSLKQFRRKHIYLYFFNDDLACLKTDTFYLRKLHNEFGNRLVVIGMNYGDEPRSMRFFQQYYQIPWIIGMSNREINKKYYVENLPKAYWIGKHRRLKRRNVSPEQMYELAVKRFKKR